MQPHYSGVAMWGSVAEDTRIWTIALTEYVFMVEVMFIVNARDGAYATYYTGNLRFNHVSGGRFSSFG